MTNSYPLKTIINELEAWAPKQFAQSYDHIGLQVGDINREIASILIRLDANHTQLTNHLKKHPTDLMITHHPLIFNPLDSIDLTNDTGKTIQTLIQSNTALYVMHTNLDAAPNGVNDSLIKAYGLNPALGKPIQPKIIEPCLKVIVYIPQKNLFRFRTNIFKKFPSIINNYTCCSFVSIGEGTFYPLPGAMPKIGKIDQLEKVPEAKLEFLIKKEEIHDCIDYIRKIHPYEEPAFDIYEQKGIITNITAAKYYRMDKKVPISTFTDKFPAHIKGYQKQKTISSVAFACGSGKHTLSSLINLKIDVLITGELDYHSTLTCEMNKITVIELGHKESEEVVLPEIKKRLKANFPSLKITIA